MRAHVVQCIHAHAEYLAVLVEGQLAGHDLIAPV
jgi:hypothetical protein